MVAEISPTKFCPYLDSRQLPADPEAGALDPRILVRIQVRICRPYDADCLTPAGSNSMNCLRRQMLDRLNGTTTR